MVAEFVQTGKLAEVPRRPSLGQLVQGRWVKAVVMFVLATVLWFFLMGWIVHLWSIIDAAVWKPRG